MDVKYRNIGGIRIRSSGDKILEQKIDSEFEPTTLM